jgi:orotidine-5'-phosphate decarboxylase
MRTKNPIIVALDVPERKEAKHLVKELIEYVSIFKIGHQLFISEGKDIIHMIQDTGGEVFLDLKFHDIPSVISNAAEVAVEEKVYMLTMHSLGGKAMLIRVAETLEALRVQSGVRTPLLLGVTILTSLDKKDLSEIGISLSMKDEVVKLASICKNSGLDGVVCSGEEISLIREKFGDEFLIVTPGVKLEPTSSDDQRRIITVEDAVKKGADYLVMGRAITTSEEPRKTMESILKKLSKI